MRAVKTPGETRPIGAPRGWDREKHGECGVLSVADVRDERTGANMMISTHQVEGDDLGKLQAGAPVHLAVYGVEHPVICLYVGNVPGQEDQPDRKPDLDQLMHALLWASEEARATFQLSEEGAKEFASGLLVGYAMGAPRAFLGLLETGEENVRQLAREALHRQREMLP